MVLDSSGNEQSVSDGEESEESEEEESAVEETVNADDETPLANPAEEAGKNASDSDTTDMAEVTGKKQLSTTETNRERAGRNG